MNPLAAWYFRTAEPFFGFGEEARRDTERALRGARIALFPEWYLSLSYLAAALAGLLSALGTGLSVGALTAAPPAIAAAVGVGAGVGAFLTVRLAFLLFPRMRAAARAKAIEEEFAAVVTLCYALSRGGVPFLKVFRIVAEERATYGEISREFGLVLRDVESLGADVITALQDAAATTPSPSLRAFFEGLVTILGSGANPVDYFKRRADAQLDAAGVRLEGEVEQVGVLAEVYVSGLLILPLLLMVVLSLLSSLGNGGAGVLPLVVFLLIPFGTFAYLLLVEIMVPPQRLKVPSTPEGPAADVGLDTVPATTARRDGELPGAVRVSGTDAKLRRRLRWAMMKERAKASYKEALAKAEEEPWRVLAVSGPLAALVLSSGLVALVEGARLSGDVWIDLTGLLLLVGVVAGTPVAVLHEVRIARIRRVEKAMPDVLGRLAGFNERGVGLLRAFEILGRSSAGPLAADLKAVQRDVSWNGHLSRALTRFRARARTLRLAKLVLLLERASTATGDVKDVLEVAERDARNTEKLRARRTQSMVTYVAVIYVVFAVFLYVIHVTANLFFADGGLVVASADGTTVQGLHPDRARLLFFQAVVIQGACAGLVAGRLGETHLLSGLKHAALLAVVAWISFQVGVLA